MSLVDDLRSIPEESNINFSNNTVAFYFNSAGDFLHGARYVETLLDGAPIYRWTSKLGRSILISHELDDLMGKYSIYGDQIAYAVVFSGVENQNCNSENF